MTTEEIVVLCECGKVFTIGAYYAPNEKTHVKRNGELKIRKSGQKMIPDFHSWPRDHIPHKIKGWMFKADYEAWKSHLRKAIEKAGTKAVKG